MVRTCGIVVIIICSFPFFVQRVVFFLYPNIFWCFFFLHRNIFCFNVFFFFFFWYWCSCELPVECWIDHLHLILGAIGFFPDIMLGFSCLTPCSHHGWPVQLTTWGIMAILLKYIPNLNPIPGIKVAQVLVYSSSHLWYSYIESDWTMYVHGLGTKFDCDQ